MVEKANSNSAVELIIFIKTPARWSGSHVAATNLGSAGGTFIWKNKWEQLGKSLGMDPVATLPTLAAVAITHRHRHGRCQRAIAPVGLEGYNLDQRDKEVRPWRI